MVAKLRKLFGVLTPKEKWLVVSGAILLFMGLFGLGFRFYLNKTILVPAQGGEHVEGVIGQPTIVNPILVGSNETDKDLATLLFAGLLDMAEEYKKSDDLRSWTVLLKKDLRWSDGEPLTSDDVLFTLETIQDISARSPLFLTWQGVVAERLSEREIKFTTKTPYAFFGDNLREFRPIPQHIFGNIPAGNLRLSGYNLEPVGSGPYVFVKYEKRRDGFITDYELAANPNYGGDKPFIEKLRVKFYGTSADLIGAFNSLVLTGFGGLDYKDIEKINVGYDLLKLQTPRYYAIFFNQSTHPALKELAVRNALSKVTDREGVVKNLLPQQARPIYGPILPDIEGYDASIYENEKFSLEEAQKILDEAKWTLGDDGVREKVIGRAKVRLEFELAVPQIPFLMQAAAMIKEDWARVGVKAIIVPGNPVDLTEAAIKTRNYNAILFGNVLKNNPDVFSFWHSSERFFPGLNLSVYENKKVDALLESIRKDPNPESRRTNLAKLQSIILDESPAIFLFSPDYLYVKSKQLKTEMSGKLLSTANRFDAVNLWHLRAKRVFKKGE
jgi:peptide/nickel transport system substrate-binding protein